MSHPVPPATVTGIRRRGRSALIGVTAAGLILGGPAAGAFAAETPAPETAGTFGQEVLPATGEATVQAPTGYQVVEEVAAQVVASETAGAVSELAAAVVAPATGTPAEQLATGAVTEAATGVVAAEGAAATGDAAPVPALPPAVLAPATPVLDPFAQLLTEAAVTAASEQVAAEEPVASTEPDTDGDGIPDSQDAYPADATNTPPATEAPAQEQPAPEAPAEQPAPTEDPAPVEDPEGGEVTAPAMPQRTAYNDENTVVEVPEQYRTSDFTYVLAGPDGTAVPVTLDEHGAVVLTPELLKDLAGGDYVLRAVQSFDGSAADISSVTVVIPSTAPASELAPTVTTGSDLIGTIGDYSKGQKIVVRDALGTPVDGAKITISDNGFYVVEGLTDGGYTLEVVGADGKRITQRSSVTLQAPAETNAPELSAPEKVTAGKPLAVDGTGYETKVELDEDGEVVSYGTVTVKVTDPVTGEVVDQRLVQLNEDGSFDYQLDTGYSADGFERLVITVTERDGTSTTRTELVAVEGNGTPVIKAPSVVAGKAPSIGGSKLVPGEEYTVVVVGPLKYSVETLVAGEDGTLNLKLADNLVPGDYRVELRNANGAPVPGQATTFQVQSDRDGDEIPDSEDNWDGPGANEPDSDGDGIPNSQDGYDGPGATAPVISLPDPWIPEQPVDPTLPSIPDIGLPGPVDPTLPGVETPAPVEPTVPVETTDPVAPTDPTTPAPTVPIGEDTDPVAPITPEDGSIGLPVPAPAPVQPGQGTPERDSESISLVEKLFSPGKSEDAAPIVNNLEQRLDASPLRDTIEKVTGMSFSRDLSERGSFQAAPNLGEVLERIQTASPGLDRGPVPMAADGSGATPGATPGAIDLRDADATAAERTGGLAASDTAFGPAGLALLGVLGAGAVAGTTYLVVRRGRGDHRA